VCALCGTAVERRNGGTSTLNSPMYKELSSDDDDDNNNNNNNNENEEDSSYPSLFVPDLPSAGNPSPKTVASIPNNNNNNGAANDDDDEDFTPTPTASLPKKRKKDPKPRKPRTKNPLDSPSKTLVNRFKQNLGEMVRTVSESPLAGQGGSQMARVRLQLLLIWWDGVLMVVEIRGVVSAACEEETQGRRGLMGL